MKDFEILSQIDNIYNAVYRLRKEPLSTAESNILSIGNMIDALRDNVEDALFDKGRKHRSSYLNAQAVVSAKAYLATRTDTCPYFIVSDRKNSEGFYHPLCTKSLENLVKKIAGRTETKKHITPHILRHTTATLALQGGCAIDIISKLLGHESINTTMIYAKTSDADVHTAHQRYIV